MAIATGVKDQDFREEILEELEDHLADQTALADPEIPVAIEVIVDIKVQKTMGKFITKHNHTKQQKGIALIGEGKGKNIHQNL